MVFVNSRRGPRQHNRAVAIRRMSSDRRSSMQSVLEMFNYREYEVHKRMKHCKKPTPMSKLSQGGRANYDGETPIFGRVGSNSF